MELLSPELTNYDLDKLGPGYQTGTDLNFTYLGFQTLYDNIFLFIVA